jgi:hypothetical protein
LNVEPVASYRAMVMRSLLSALCLHPGWHGCDLASAELDYAKV